MKLITVHLPPAYIRILKELVKMGRYPNVSEAIRAAVRDLVNREYYGILQLQVEYQKRIPLFPSP